MKWFIIDKSKSEQPKKGNYNNPKWKAQISEECKNQCIYCALHDNKFGGPRNYHVEHYKPKSIYKTLKKDIKNLYYCCGVCNTFKGKDWPNDWKAHELDEIAYPDPSLYDYNNLFEIDRNNYRLSGMTNSGKYIINKLYLNRPQLILERREHELLDKYESVKEELNEVIRKINRMKKGDFRELTNDIDAYTEFTDAIDKLLSDRRRISPYAIFDVVKPK